MSSRALASRSWSGPGTRASAFLAGWARTIAQLTQHLFQGHDVAAGGGAFALPDGRQLLWGQRLVVVGNVLGSLGRDARHDASGSGGAPDWHEVISAGKPIALYHRVGNGRAVLPAAKDVGNEFRLAWIDAP